MHGPYSFIWFDIYIIGYIIYSQSEAWSWLNWRGFLAPAD